MTARPKYGQTGCMATYRTGQKAGQLCANKAYYEQNGLYLCGTHSNGIRVQLPKATSEEKKEAQLERLTDHMASLTLNSQAARVYNRQGRVILFKMHHRKAVQFVDGYLNVFPNYNHETRKDGYGCASLSPMSLGPVDHGQPGLPVSQNLENFHQGNKFYPGEDPKVFQISRLAFYNDVVPHRHKFTSADKPLYSVWIDKQGVEHHIDYVTSRQFYCTLYERLVRKQKALSELIRMLTEGINLRICGFDADSIENLEDIETAYLDSSQRFGHERVLCTMFTLPAEKYPWIKYKSFDF
jgi:hypothetical protein